MEAIELRHDFIYIKQKEYETKLMLESKYETYVELLKNLHAVIPKEEMH